MVAKVPSNGVSLSDFTVSGTTPFVTIGDAGAEDAGIIFDGNAQDFYVALDDSADSLLIGVGASVGTTACIVVDATGAVTKPLQPAFSVKKASSQANMSSGVQLVFDTEIFDQNADFASNSFTAPVTGRYQLNLQLRMAAVDADANYIFAQIETSNRTYQSIFDPSKGSGDLGFFTMSINAVADMDANDTADVHFYYNGGAAQTDTDNDGTIFSGALLC